MVTVVAVNQSQKSSQLVKEAEKIADAFDSDLHIVHVLKTDDFVDIERSNVKQSGEPVEMDDIREHASTIAQESAEGITEDFTPVGLVGQPTDRIIAYAEEHDADYIVIGGRKQSPIGKVVFGSITQSILLNSKTPVLTVLEPDTAPEGEPVNHDHMNE
jgi:nucleotide-binding universal stress UspA family protein